MIQNDISKRHQNDISDRQNKNLDISSIFSQPLEKSFMFYTRKVGKIVSAIYLVTDVMDQGLPLSGSLRSQSLELLNACYDAMVYGRLGSDSLARVAVRVEQVANLIEIGSIARHISPMNADMLVTELSKIKELLAEDIRSVRQQEKSFMIHRPITGQSMIPDTVLADQSFDHLVERHESKRHQNDIKTTLTTQVAQNDTVNDKSEIKTTFKTTNQNDIDRKQEILSVIKSRHLSTMQDIKTALKDYSDKTIQREIALLIDMGLVRREGNKRWATYRAV